MVTFNKFQLENGLKVIVHEDPFTPMAAVNILYNVGARDEDEKKTGFAHLFEHLMFGGSENAPNFDEPLQRAGGESNAFTNNDITNYYDLLPAENLETAFWLESDRMQSLTIDQHSLDVQRKVVCEEFKEHYLNQPYGDLWHKLSSLAYKVHPYKWPTIGKDLSHIEQANIDDVTKFFQKYYHPQNAIMVVAGNVKTADIRDLTEKWFGMISSGGRIEKHFPKEPPQKEPRLLEVEAHVPLNSILKAWHMGDRKSRNYYVIDLVSDLLSEGPASRLYQNLVKKQKLFSEIDAFISGSIDEGLIVIEGKLSTGVSMKKADAAITAEVDKIKSERLAEIELQKIKNKMESSHVFSEVNLLTRATHLAYYELLGDVNLINTDIDHYLTITSDDVIAESEKVFRPENCSTIYYNAKPAEA